MSSTANGTANKKPRTAGSNVRFREDPEVWNGVDEEKENGHVCDVVGASHRRPKRPRPERPNPDEIDDIDDYVPEQAEEGKDDQIIPGENETVQAKRKRRLKHAGDDIDEGAGSTQIDQETSLASEGIPIEPFHMQEENEDGTGYFDGDTYVFRRHGGAGVGEEPDAWLDNLENEGDEERIQTSSSTNNRNFDREDKSVSEKMDAWSKEDLYAKLLPLVSDSETVSQAIVRYGKLMKQKTDENNSRDLAKAAFNDLTEAASALLLKGVIFIYQQTRRDITKLLPDNDHTNSKPKAPVLWEYQGSDDGQIHGPYTTEQMQGWIHQGYFVGPTAVHIRTVSEIAPVDATLQDDLLSDLLEDEEDDAKPLSKVRGEWIMSDQVDFQHYM